MRSILGLSLLAITLIFTSCDQETIDRESILKYIQDNNLTAIEGDNGLYYVIDSTGNGDSPTIADEVRVNYTGRYTDDELFDQGANVTFPLNALILGWQYGLPQFKEGDSGLLLIPSHLGYGSNPPGDIRPNAVLVFEIDLLEVI